MMVRMAERARLIAALQQGTLKKETFLRQMFCLYADELVGSRTAGQWVEGLVEETLTADMMLAQLPLVHHDVMKDMDQYSLFNAIAKELLYRADLYEFRDLEKFLSLRKVAFEVYKRKDHVAISLVEKMPVASVEAYYLSLDSEALDGTIVEIFLRDLSYGVLHVRSESAVRAVQKRGIIIGECRRSKISHYTDSRSF